MRPSTAPRQVLTDWASNRLPHFAPAQSSALRTVARDVVETWKREMGYEAVLERMKRDPEIDRYAMSDERRVFRTANIQPEEETLDYSCFLPAAEREDDEDDEDGEADEAGEADEQEEMEEEEVPELVEDEDVALLE